MADICEAWYSAVIIALPEGEFTTEAKQISLPEWDHLHPVLQDFGEADDMDAEKRGLAEGRQHRCLREGDKATGDGPIGARRFPLRQASVKSAIYLEITPC